MVDLETRDCKIVGAGTGTVCKSWQSAAASQLARDSKNALNCQATVDGPLKG